MNVCWRSASAHSWRAALPFDQGILSDRIKAIKI
jgi:hypothetical protein